MLRNVCYREATQAYIHGNSALASELSKKGRKHQAQMKIALEKARDEIVITGILEPKSVKTVDFHGMHVKESLDALEELLNFCAVQQVTKLLRIITGRGKHSEGGKARIYPAVKSYLQDKGYNFNEPNPGVIVVVL